MSSSVETKDLHIDAVKEGIERALKIFRGDETVLLSFECSTGHVKIIKSGPGQFGFPNITMMSRGNIDILRRWWKEEHEGTLMDPQVKAEVHGVQQFAVNAQLGRFNFHVPVPSC